MYLGSYYKLKFNKFTNIILWLLLFIWISMYSTDYRLPKIEKYLINILYNDLT